MALVLIGMSVLLTFLEKKVMDVRDQLPDGVREPDRLRIDPGRRAAVAVPGPT